MFFFRYDSDSEQSSLVIIDNEETKKYVFNPFPENFLDTGHWVDPGYNAFVELMPDELSIIYEEDSVMNSLNVDVVEPNKQADEETEDAIDATATMTNDHQMLKLDNHETTKSLNVDVNSNEYLLEQNNNLVEKVLN